MCCTDRFICTRIRITVVTLEQRSRHTCVPKKDEQPLGSAGPSRPARPAAERASSGPGRRDRSSSHARYAPGGSSRDGYRRPDIQRHHGRRQPGRGHYCGNASSQCVMLRRGTTFSRESFFFSSGASKRCPEHTELHLLPRHHHLRSRCSALTNLWMPTNGPWHNPSTRVHVRRLAKRCADAAHRRHVADKHKRGSAEICILREGVCTL